MKSHFGADFDKNYVINPSNLPNHGYLFFDHSLHGQSGHLGHALFQSHTGEITAFFPICSNDNGGHSAKGWMCFRRSTDFGQTWSTAEDFIWSKQLYEQNGKVSMMCEKAVTCSDGSIILFALTCDLSQNPLWEPYLVPQYLKSFDHGYTWTSPKPFGEDRGRIYDAVYHNHCIYVLKFANSAEEDWTGCRPEHIYQLFVSTDNGNTFSLRSVIPFYTYGRGYGTMEFTKNGRLIVSVYNINDETVLDTIYSDDNGYTWSGIYGTYLEKRIRNPQMISFGDGFFLHGRSGNGGNSPGNFVLYYSSDGFHWDNGRYLCLREAGYGEYSNSLVVHNLRTDQYRLLIHSSHAYRDNLTNILSWWIDFTPSSSENRFKTLCSE